MKKFLVCLMFVMIIFTAQVMAANAAYEIYYFTITDSIGDYIHNLEPPVGTALNPADFVISFDVKPTEAGGYIPDAKTSTIIGILTTTKTPLVDEEGYHLEIRLTDLDYGKKVNITIDDNAN